LTEAWWRVGAVIVPCYSFERFVTREGVCGGDGQDTGSVQGIYPSCSGGRYREEQTMNELPKQLPADYVEFAKGVGRSYCHGFYRFPGLETAPPYDVVTWNDPDTWRFAWPNLKESFFFFGLSAFGDAYAFDLEDIDAGVIYFGAYAMDREIAADSFRRFKERHLFVLEQAPVDDAVLDLFDKYGECRWDQGFAGAPPPLFTPDDVPCMYEPIDMRFLMIMNGDIYSQYLQLPEGAVLVGIDTEMDRAGRLRLKLLTK